MVAYTLEQIGRKISLAQVSLLMLFMYRLKSLEVLAPLMCSLSVMKVLVNLKELTNILPD